MGRDERACYCIIIPFRDPIQHAESLRRQHVKWCKRHQQDPFSLSYMTWLAHHEFGLDHRPFKFEHSYLNILQAKGVSITLAESIVTDQTHLIYWLIRWIEGYHTVLIHHSQQMILVCYEYLTQDADHILKQLYQEIDIDVSAEQQRILAQRIKAAPQRQNLWKIDHYTEGKNTFTDNFSDQRNGELTGDGLSLTEFVTAIREDRQPISNIEDCLETMRLYDAVLQTQQGGPTIVPLEK